ncbi:MAG TPA: Uma2 family endonuclease [Ktedonosporobacter sp.]|jgi:Uma2 family endonuclease|nr:Uma2 family endonuclease [Ktedonosporobacter sp.]
MAELMSFEAYLALIEQDPEHSYEYLDGRVYMMTGGSPDHAIIGSNLNALLQTSLRGRRCIVYNSDVYVQLSEHYRVCPDVTVSCDPRDRGAQDAIRFPTVVAEVLSPGTEALDRGQKSLQYRLCPSIQEYLLVSSEFPLVEVFRREKQGFWSLYTLVLHDTIELNSLGLRLSVADVYHNTSFLE